MTVALGLLIGAAGLVLLYGAIRNRSPWGIILSLVTPGASIAPITKK
jgi:hypothetical protein